MDFSRFSFVNRPARILALAFLGTLWGCGDETPPYEDLPLRDALRAAPEVVATLSEDSRHDLALRFQKAAQVDPETLTFAPESLSLEPLVSAADAQREAAGKDAVMLGEILATDGHGLLEIQALSEADFLNAAPFEIQGNAADVATPFEEAALQGEAGKTLRGFVARTHAQKVLRMTGLPIAAVAWNDKVYVNEAWLVAMSALEVECAAPPIPALAGGNGPSPPPGAQPMSVDFSPFDLPGNLHACAVQVQQTCACATTNSCTHVPTDQTFSDANAECAWANQQEANASALCLMALLSLDNVRECVEDASPGCSFMPVSDRSVAVQFVTDQRCGLIIDSCLTNGTASTSTGSSSKCGSGDDCRYCDGKGDDCRQCASDCDSFAKTCELCIEICAICAENAERRTTVESPHHYAAIRPVTQCSVRTNTGRSPLPAPAGTAFWLLAPVGYWLARSRRRM